MNKFPITVNGEEITAYRVNGDINGNPRYVVHFLSLGVQPNDYGKIRQLTKYRAKWFTGGYVFTSYCVQEDLEWMIRQVQHYYRSKNPVVAATQNSPSVAPK